MRAEFSPAIILIVGACLVPLARGRLRLLVIGAVPLAAAASLAAIPLGAQGSVTVFGASLQWLHFDPLARLFAWAFMAATLLVALYGLHRPRAVEYWAVLAYAGAAIGGVLAADLMTFMIFWELTTLFSVVLVWAGTGRDAFGAGMRYLGLQVCSGLLLLVGVVALVHAHHTVYFSALDLSDPAIWAIFAAFGIKAAFPLVHTWLPDAYPEASPFGTVALSVFTTKLAIYALLRGFPGAAPLVPIGAAMIVFASFYAFAVPNLQRALCYALIAQLGIMVTGIGLGSPLALDGAAAHAIASIFYQALLFMGIGAVLYRTGTDRPVALGGLWREMPWTAACTCIAAGAMAALPLLSGFTSKTMVLIAAEHDGPYWAQLVLLFGAAAAVLYVGLRVPIGAFFGPPRGGREPVREAPWPMVAAMVLAALPCVLFGLWPAPLYAVLPQAAAYQPYRWDVLLADAALGFGAALAFAIAFRRGSLPDRTCPRLWEADWLYRRASPVLIARCAEPIQVSDRWFRHFWLCRLDSFIATLRRHHGPRGILARTWPTGSTVLWVAVILCASLLLYGI